MGHFLSEALRANLVTKEPFLQHGAINPTGPSSSTEVRCSQGDLLLIAGYGHRLVEHVRTVGVVVKVNWPTRAIPSSAHFKKQSKLQHFDV